MVISIKNIIQNDEFENTSEDYHQIIFKALMRCEELTYLVITIAM